VDLNSLVENPVTTGPFKVKSFERDIVTELERNPDYWDKDEAGRQLPYLDGIRWFQFFDRTLAGSALRTGRVKYMDYSQTPVI
jgi:peptide/nickel transport system substrate-binding protein/oligopeptide transport system substrate-binding protein